LEFRRRTAADVADFREAASSPVKKKTLAPPPVQAWQRRSASSHRLIIIGERMRRRLKGTEEKELKIVIEIVGGCTLDWK
jgi:hypothetical protein